MRTFLCFACIATFLVHASCKDENCPAACLTVSDSTTVAAFDTVKFINCSTGYDSILIDFGDNQSSTEDTCYHVFTHPGDYTVKLNALTNDCITVAEKTIKVTGNVPEMIYGAYMGEGCAGIIVCKKCVTCSSPYQFILDGVFNGYEVRVRLDGDSIYLSPSIGGLHLNGNFSADLKTITFVAAYATQYLPDPPEWVTCGFTGTRN